ncbi:restriction endonuclease, partial [Zunongwangia sp. F363]
AVIPNINSMNNYDFSTINDKEFEIIVRDLLNKEFKFKLQSFKKGKDKGIDLRHSTSDNNNSIIVQAKHYSNSKYSNLKHDFEKKELPKIKDLKPNRYIVVTSLALSAQNKDELKKILSPYVQTSNDIIGRDELNEYLNKYPDIEKQHYKLWLSSINILESIFNKAIEGRTKFFIKELKRKINYYVVTQKLDHANKILRKKKLLLITGQPGIGKTSLAEILLFDRLREGFEIYQIEDIGEAESIISFDNNSKQIIYFDDFLGANYTEIMNSHNRETRLTNFVDRIINTPNKYLILTTRTVVLNIATNRYEKLNRSNLNKRQFELKLTDYSAFEKAQILYNHFFHKNVDQRFYEVLLENNFYRKIIKHRNYTPRLVEFITNEFQIKDFTRKDYKEFILRNLDNPEEIWRHSFNNQINHFDKCLLLTMFSFGNEVDEDILIKAFDNRLNYEKEAHNQIIQNDQFNKSIKTLLNGFLVSRLNSFQENLSRRYSFINPSLADFFISYAKESFSVRKDIISSIVYLNQLERFKVLPLENELQIFLKGKSQKTYPKL